MYNRSNLTILYHGIRPAGRNPPAAFICGEPSANRVTADMYRGKGTRFAGEPSSGLRQPWGNWGPKATQVPVKMANFERGTTRGDARCCSVVSPEVVVNRNLVRFLEMVLSPRDQLTSSLIWSAKEIEGYGGKETSANLAANLEVLLTLDVGF